MNSGLMISERPCRSWKKDIDVRNAKDALRAALEQGLIDDGNLWSDIHENRNRTEDFYSEEDAQIIFTFIKTNGAEAMRALHRKLTCKQ